LRSSGFRITAMITDALAIVLGILLLSARSGDTAGTRLLGVAAIVGMTSGEPRHCWVVDPPGYPGRWPGLVLQWALTDADRWAGRAVFAVDTGDHAGLIELWLDQAHLTRAKVIDD